MLPIFSYLALLFLPLGAAASDDAQGTSGIFTLFRWNQGFRAEREALLTETISEKKFLEIIQRGKLPANEEVYSGCYLAHFERTSSRELASKKTQSQPASQTFRVCLPNKISTEGDLQI